MIFKQTAEFTEEICGIKRPLVPTRLDDERKLWFHRAMQEELREFMVKAESLEDEVDAILDMMYFAAGRLHEMGLRPDFSQAMFDEVHRANMQKQRGSLAKRPGSRGHDAVKPEGWTPPNVQGLLEVHPRPKLLIVGHGRHGKDTVGEMLRDKYGLSFKSSSLFCAEKVIWPILVDHDTREAFLSTVRPYFGALYDSKVGVMQRSLYANAEEAFNDRHNHRDVWFQAIKWWCDPHWRLGQAILEEHDVYCGVRNPAELNGIWNAGLADAIVWVDASDRLPPEDASSMKLEPWMATHMIDNNGTLEQLERNVESLMEALYG